MCEGALGDPSTVINSFYPVMQQAMNDWVSFPEIWATASFSFPVPTCCWESCLWSDHDLKYTIVLSRNGLESLYLWFSGSIYSFFYLARAVIRSWLVSAAGTHAVLQVVTWMLSSHHHSAPCTSWACSASSGPLLHRGQPCGTSVMSLLTCVFVGCYPQNVVPQLYELWTVLVTQLCPTLRPHRL